MTRAIERIRAVTQQLHDELEQLPHARAMLDGSLSIVRYTSYLRALHIVHQALELASGRADDEVMRLVHERARQRRSDLERDLVALESDPREVDAQSLIARSIAGRIQHAGDADSAHLLGYAYVLEGSQLGGLVQCRALEARPELRRGGLLYLFGAGAETRARFVRFLACLEAALTNEARIERAAEGAVAAFEGFSELFQSA